MDSEKIDKLRVEFLRACAANGPAGFYDAEVLEVDSDAYTCTVLIDEATIYDVRLRAVVSDNQSLDVLPETGAQVVVGKLADDDFIVIACDKISSYRLTIGTVVFKLDGTGTLISKGDETLKKIMSDLVDLVLEVYAPKNVPGLTALKLRIDNLLK